MTELNNNKLKGVSGGTGIENGGFQIGDWVCPSKMKLSPGATRIYYRIDDIEEPDSRLPRYVVNRYRKNHSDGSISKLGFAGAFFADELVHENDPTFSGDLDL